MEAVCKNKIPDVRSKTASLVTKPLTYEKLKAPYYREQYALQLQVILDMMIVDREDRLVLYKDYPELSKHSLYNRINQSLQYLIHELDTPDSKYATLRFEIKLKPETKGVRLKFNKPLEPLIAHKAEPVVEEKKPDAVVSKIQTLIAEFIADSEQNFFLCKDIALTHKQVFEIIEFLDSYKVDKLLYHVYRKSIRIVKIGKECSGQS